MKYLTIIIEFSSQLVGQAQLDVRPLKKSNSKPSSDDIKPREHKAHKSTLQNFKSTATKLICKICGAVGHSLGQCTNFDTYETKLALLKELSMCQSCAGSGHNEDSCFGKQAKLRFQCRSC